MRKAWKFHKIQKLQETKRFRKAKDLCKFCLFFMALIGPLFLTACNAEKHEQEIETERQAFLLYNDLIFIADVPKNWRYVLSPAYDYPYYRDLIEYDEKGQRSIVFMGVGVKGKDGEDNFFTFCPKREAEPIFNPDLPIMSDHFVFQDNTEGKWDYQIREEAPRYGAAGIMPFYSGTVYDLGENYHIDFSMLGEEYDANEQVIKRFLESSCFRTSDLGLSKEKEIWKREQITLHVWSKSVRMSIQVPEGAGISSSKEGDNFWIHLDEEKKSFITICNDYEKELLDSCGDYEYYLNVEDFEETVYEIRGRIKYRIYYFPNRFIEVGIVGIEEGTELWNCAKKIVQSIRFE